jgi:hypothetical protein
MGGRLRDAWAYVMMRVPHTVYVNCYDVFSASAPFGGFKR